MRPLEALRALARLAADNETDHISALAEAARITGSTIGSGDVRLFAGDGTHFQVYPEREDEDFFGLTPEGLMVRSNEARKANAPIVFCVGADHQPHDFALADGQAGGTYLTVALWCGEALAGSIVADGPWTPAQARRGGDFLESAGPALALMLERVIDADRTKRIEAQMSALSSVASVFVEAKNMQDALQDVANAINTFLQSQRDLAQLDPDLISNVELLEQEIIVVAEPVTNSLIISATRRYYDQIMEMVHTLDKPPGQVIIQILLVEVELDNSDEFGVELGFQDSLLFDRGLLNAENLQTIETTIFDPNGIPQTTFETIINSESVPGFNFANASLPLGNNTAISPASGSW